MLQHFVSKISHKLISSLYLPYKSIRKSLMIKILSIINFIIKTLYLLNLRILLVIIKLPKIKQIVKIKLLHMTHLKIIKVIYIQMKQTQHKVFHNLFIQLFNSQLSLMVLYYGYPFQSS